MDEAERLLPALIAAGYSEDHEGAWSFTSDGRDRAQSYGAHDCDTPSGSRSP
jgi:hypothetical protein